MAKAGAPIIGINCLFDPFIALETISKMKVKIIIDFAIFNYRVAAHNLHAIRVIDNRAPINIGSISDTNFDPRAIIVVNNGVFDPWLTAIADHLQLLSAERRAHRQRGSCASVGHAEVRAAGLGLGAGFAGDGSEGRGLQR